MRRGRPLIAIVGRPNVGKSTMFNRMIRSKRAIVEDQPGVTRDRHYADCELNNVPVTLVDTGGFVPDNKESPLARYIRQQAQAAVEECDVVLFVVDARTGPTSEDQDVANYLRKSSKPVLLLVNKTDGRRDAEEMVADFHRFGLGTPFPVSAEHNEGMIEVLEALIPKLPETAPIEEKIEDVPEADRPVRIAIVGRPNVGKSTLVNSLLGEERVISSPIAGTTRDAIDSELEFKGRKFILTDTAGIRRKSTITQRVEGFSVMGALRAAEDADVVVLMIDATEPAVEQDRKIAHLAESKGRGLVIVVNKWDLVKATKKEENFRAGVKWILDWVDWAPMVFVSAHTGEKVSKVLEIALEVFEQQYFRAATPKLNKIVEHVTTEHSLPIIAGKQLKIYYAAQVATAPLAFTMMVNQPKGVPDRYERYVINYLRKVFRLKVPIRVFWRPRPGQKKRAEAAQRFRAREKSKQRAR
ncbi:MAG: ribosome biogenesis GTPase Der [Archangium sp.]|nr:ribosome biogenesis GTPase Der [Archangium sp.]MDP3157745.1 ribosome biogenesis GTPase Der [Archangium sp.]MDP3575264.1 ribosome biogenesis GTPase Der [Archangium sp.]